MDLSETIFLNEIQFEAPTILPLFTNRSQLMLDLVLPNKKGFHSYHLIGEKGSLDEMKYFELLTIERNM